MQVEQGFAGSDHESLWRSQLHKACKLLSSSKIADLLKDSFRCAWPGFASGMTAAVAQSISSQVSLAR